MELDDPYKEALALAPSTEVELGTLQISHPEKAEVIYLVQDRADHTFTLEDDTTHLFKKCGFNFSRPAQTDTGVQSLNIVIDNIEREVSDYIESVEESNIPITIIYRPYLLSDPSHPAATPLVLSLTDVSIEEIEVRGRASFADIVNKKFLTELYTRARFPSLANN